MVTSTTTAPAACDGARHAIFVELVTSCGVTMISPKRLLPKRHALAGESKKPVPRIATKVPPTTEPELGLTSLTVGFS